MNIEKTLYIRKIIAEDFVLINDEKKVKLFEKSKNILLESNVSYLL